MEPGGGELDMVGGGVYSGETTSVYTQLYRVPTVNPTRTTMIKNTNTRTPRIMKTVIPRDELVDGESEGHHILSHNIMYIIKFMVK